MSDDARAQPVQPMVPLLADPPSSQAHEHEAGATPAAFLEYRKPKDEVPTGVRSVLSGAVAIALAAFSVLMAVPGVWVVWEELSDQKRPELDRLIFAALTIVLALIALGASIATTRDYLSGRNERRRRHGRM